MPTGPRRIAVLPFENLGDSADAYFADGITDEVRGKLAQVPALAVIARGSSNEYRRSPKSLQEIGRELGAEYLLTATVRWEKSGGVSRVRVSPELLQIEPNAAPTDVPTNPPSSTPEPSATPVPSETATELPTAAPLPSDTPTPSETPAPTETATSAPTETPLPSDTPVPSDTPAPSETPAPTEAPTEPPPPSSTP